MVVATWRVSFWLLNSCATPGWPLGFFIGGCAVKVSPGRVMSLALINRAVESAVAALLALDAALLLPDEAADPDDVVDDLLLAQPTTDTPTTTLVAAKPASAITGIFMLPHPFSSGRRKYTRKPRDPYICHSTPEIPAAATGSPSYQFPMQTPPVTYPRLPVAVTHALTVGACMGWHDLVQPVRSEFGVQTGLPEYCLYVAAKS
jgi:hypothetical protein